MTHPANSLHEMLAGSPTLAAVAARLESLPPEQRALELQHASAAQLHTLWELSASGSALGMAEAVPDAQATDKPVRWVGRNNLPMFSFFEKRLWRDGQGRVWGYNHQTMSPFTGPGYFSVIQHPERPHELLFDYTALPTVVPAGLPRVTSNARGISFFVYHRLKDAMRRVCKGVMVGQASKGGSVLTLGGYFAVAAQF